MIDPNINNGFEGFAIPGNEVNTAESSEISGGSSVPHTIPDHHASKLSILKNLKQPKVEVPSIETPVSFEPPTESVETQKTQTPETVSFQGIELDNKQSNESAVNPEQIKPSTTDNKPKIEQKPAPKAELEQPKPTEITLDEPNKSGRNNVTPLFTRFFRVADGKNNIKNGKKGGVNGLYEAESHLNESRKSA